MVVSFSFFFFFQAEDGIRDADVTGVQTCALPIARRHGRDGASGCHGERPRRGRDPGDEPGRAAAPPAGPVPRRARALLRQTGTPGSQDRPRDDARPVDGRRARAREARRALVVTRRMAGRIRHSRWERSDPMNIGAEHLAPRVGVIMGSDSDWPVMKAAAEALTEFEVAHEVSVVSAHRTPQRMLDYARTAADRGLRVIIA